MTKDVLISISGLQFNGLADEEDGEPIEIITPASYYWKNDKHYVVYDEVIEGMPGTIKNTIKITGDSMFEIKKNGIANTHMMFEKDKMNMTSYVTPYGEMMVGIHTKDIKVNVEEQNINVKINYALDINSEPLADCQIKVSIKGGF